VEVSDCCGRTPTAKDNTANEAMEAKTLTHISLYIHTRRRAGTEESATAAVILPIAIIDGYSRICHRMPPGGGLRA
jgi:hypothetical protein